MYNHHVLEERMGCTVKLFPNSYYNHQQLTGVGLVWNFIAALENPPPILCPVLYSLLTLVDSLLILVESLLIRVELLHRFTSNHDGSSIGFVWPGY